MKKKKLQVLPFRCVNCMQSLAALEQDLIYFCAYCQTGLILKQGRLQKAPVVFAKPSQTVSVPIYYLPFWAFDAKGELYERETHEGYRHGIKARRRHAPAAEDPPPHPVPDEPRAPIHQFETRYLLPAFETSEMVRIGALFSGNRFDIEETAGVRLLGGVITEDEARQVADLVYIFFEAARTDHLKSIDFKLTLDRPEIVALPFAAEDKYVLDLTLGFKWTWDVFADWQKIIRFEPVRPK